MNKHHLVVLFSQSDLFFQNDQLVLRVLIQADFADTQNGLFLQEIRNQRNHLASKSRIVGFLRIDTQPREMFDPKLRGTFRLVLGELSVVVVKTLS